MPLNGKNSLMDNDAMNRVYLRHAYQYAMSCSKDPSTQLGAILVKPNIGIIAWGVNGIPEKIKDTEDKWQYPKKNIYVEHAERNVIYKCVSRGINTSGLVMYCPWYSCVDCARAIIEAGIVGIVGHKEMFEHTNNRWKETVDKGISLLKEAGVKCELWSGRIESGISIKVNQKTFEP
jgi:dCMP deaminase